MHVHEESCFWYAMQTFCNFCHSYVNRAPPSVTQIKVLLAHSSGERLYVGTEGGSVFTLTLPSLQVLEEKTVGHEMALHG